MMYDFMTEIDHPLGETLEISVVCMWRGPCVRVQACVFVLECGCECLRVISELCVCGGVRVV